MRNALARSEQVLDEIETLLGAVTKRRRAEADAKMDMAKAKDTLAVVARNLTIEIAASEGFGEVTDPRNGERSVEWTQWVIDREMEKHDDYQQAMTGYYDAQEALQNAQISLIDTGEAMGAKKSEARLLSAILILMGEDEHGL